MKKWNVFGISGLALALISGLVLFSSLLSQQKQAKSPADLEIPVSFSIQLPHSLKQKVIKKIHEDNQLLPQLLEDLRSEKLDNDESITGAAHRAKEKFKKSYLNRARLIMDDGRGPRDGWKDIVKSLKKVADQSTEVRVQKVEVLIYYVSPGDVKDPRLDVDLKMNIRTTVVLGNHNDVLDGWLCHRRTCEIGPCEEM